MRHPPTGPGKIEVKPAPASPGGLKMEALLFNFNIEEAVPLKKEHTDWLDANVIPALKADGRASIALSGTASQTGTATFDRDLSKRRVEAVRDYLLKRGVNPAQVAVSWTGKDRSTSKLKEDERDRAVALTASLLVKIEKVLLMRDSFTAPLSWDEVIGLDTTTINIQVEASGAPASSLPDPIKVSLSSRAPNKTGGPTTISAPLSWKVPRFGADPLRPDVTLYRLTQHIAAAGLFLAVEVGKTPEVATLVRDGGTSDAEFRKALGWANRGKGKQPTSVGGTTSSEAGEVPDALKLLQSGGVEVLEVDVAAQPGWDVRGGSSTRLIRSPADIFYYTGHGLGGSNCMAIETASHSYACWATPADVLKSWTKPMDLDVLIIAGCSLLRIDFSTTPPTGPGLEWAKLLNTKQGPLVAILGYEASAPLDSSAGNAIAAEMGKRIAGGSRKFVDDWLNINGDKRAWNAVAMDRRGYWTLDPTTVPLLGVHTGGFSIKGPTPIP